MSEAVVAEWLEALDELRQEIDGWAFMEADWELTAATKRIEEPGLPPYDAPVLVIATPQGEVVVEPAFRHYPRSSGRVDLYGFPGLYRVMLLRDPGSETNLGKSTWSIRSDSGLPYGAGWTAQTFKRLVRDLTRHG